MFYLSAVSEPFPVDILNNILYILYSFSDIFMNNRGQPTEHTGFADCSYFGSSSGAAFAPVPSPVATAPQLLIDTQLAQVLLLLSASAVCVYCLLAQNYSIIPASNVILV